ncbi:signal transduction histidine kinase [Rhizomicrobium palustre]|uniref:histidine kinase n=1 Tax=Rhizomicrobium palustre TaxID=189966 RepID=A0A846N1V5_9PROT|nr:ATP-binding protein [Rhizomicrobium palustre]NIK89928.1 signal transduction histidine kinase [Rhizomicrobium palustre]
MKLWPRTLGVQLIVVTTMAIVLSNAAVALWFELGRERQNEAQVTDRMVDRATSLAALMATIQPKARVAAAQALESRYWHYRLHIGKHVPRPMSEAEAKLAERLRAALPEKAARQPVEVHLLQYKADTTPAMPAVEMTLPVVRGTELIATYVRPEGPTWPSEMFIAGILSTLMASVAGIYLARKVARPLSKLAQAAASVAKGDPPPHVPEVGPDDVRRAAEAFNAMAGQVTRTLASQRHLLSAVGHDLRTPLTAMRINLEFVEDPELRDRLLHNLDELQDLTEAVLSAAKGTGGEVRRQIDLAALVESICADLDDLGAPVAFESETQAPLFCRANEIRRAVRNLVENALAYGKSAEISLKEGGGVYEVWVEDRGPGIAAADRQRVFEPFVRLETSRNGETGGTGLGLTLVKAIAEGHGGRVALEDRPGGGLRARLILPRQQTPTGQRLSREAR